MGHARSRVESWRVKPDNFLCEHGLELANTAGAQHRLYSASHRDRFVVCRHFLNKVRACQPELPPVSRGSWQ
jgi:hypothetical protein